MPLQRAKFPPPSLLSSPFPPVLAPFFSHRARLGSLQPTGPSPLGDPCSRGGPQPWRGPQLYGGPSPSRGPQPRGGPCVLRDPSPLGGPSPCVGVPHPVGAGGALPSPRTGGGGHPPAPQGFGAHPTPPPPPQPQVLGVSQVWGGRRPPALTQPCSCSAPGRGRSPAAASLALVGGGIN